MVGGHGRHATPVVDAGVEQRTEIVRQVRRRLEMDLRRQTGVSVIALRYADGHYEVSPDATRTLDGGTSMIALGDRDQLARLRSLLSQNTGA